MSDQNLPKILDTLARVDERTASLQHQASEHRELVKASLTEIKKSVEDLKEKVDEDFVRKESFSPVQRIVYGLVSIIMTAVVVAVIGLVILK